jgi:hypothetical protein
MAKLFQLYKHDDLDGQGDHSNPTQFSDLDPALCTSGGGWSSLHSRLIDALLSAVEIFEREREREREIESETPSHTGDFIAPPLDDLAEPVNCMWIPHHDRDLYP